MAELQLTDQQRAVVENRGGSLLVSAAAGSGKTKVLVERLFRRVAEDGCNLDDFLIITYTKAAAAELRGKIAAELGRRIAAAPENLHLRRQLLAVYQADIKTVDAFCTSLLRENTHLLAREEDRHSLSPDFRVLDEDEARLLRERVLERTLEDFYGSSGEDGAALADTLGFGRDDRALSALVLEVFEKLQSHARPEQWLAETRRRWQALAEGGAVFDETVYARVLLEGAARRCAHWSGLLERSASEMGGCPALERGYADRFRSVARQLDGLRRTAECGGWDGARDAALALEFPKLAPVKDADGGGEKPRAKALWDGCKAAVKELRELLDVSAREAMEDLADSAPSMTALTDLTADFARRYRAEKLRLNAADFSDQEHLALALLENEDGTQTPLGEQAAARYQEILVDEYQDTNEVQNRIFRAVSKDGRNLFTVGDVKQSIYRFRLADPGIFLRKYAAFRPYEEAEEGEERKILLSRNFRSRRQILDAANFLFQNILSPEMGEMAYGEDEALHFGAEYYPPRSDCAVEFHLLACDQRAEEDAAPVRRLDAEARFTARRIRRLLDEGFPVTEGDGTLRPCRAEDIVILMRAPGSRTAAYAAALAEAGVPCAFEESEDFFSSMEVSTVLSLLEIIDNPRQDIPLIAVLRSPLFGFTPDRLARVRLSAPEGDFYTAVERDGGEDCRDFLETLSRLRLSARDRSVGALLWQIYNERNVLGVFGAMDGGDARREHLIALTEHAEKLEGGGYRGVFAFVTQLRRLLATGRAPRTAGASDRSGVRILSIHKSKGLEFPIVFLTDLDHAFSRQDFASPVLVHPRLGLGPTRVDLARRIKYPTLARQALQAVLERENKAEEQRILYVAMTRAKEKLILVDAMYHAPTRLRRLAALSGCPALPEAVGTGGNFADWILLPLLCRPESAPLRALAEMEAGTLYTGDTAPWEVAVHGGEALSPAEEICGEGTAPAASAAEAAGETASFDPALLEFQYPHQRAASLPAKLTATELKGREPDAEIAEAAACPPRLRPLSQPRFCQARAGLTPAESGTATHLALQYLDFAQFDVAGQVERLRSRRLLTAEQAAAVQCGALERFLRSPLAEELRRAARIWREYRFTLLLDAGEIDPAAAGDSVLLQGIVDCCFVNGDGTLTVVDFKTDRVFGDGVRERAERYRPQLEAYSAALERVLERPVGRRVLCFLHPGETVEV